MLKIDLQFFGGRGSSSSGSGGGSANGELVLPDGSKIEFEGELKYGGNDPNFTGKQRQIITDWEKKRGEAKIEYGYAVDADGNPIGKEIRGGKGSVKMPYSYTQGDGNAWSHVHPRGDGTLGGTFSDADLRIFAFGKSKTARATAKEGTYSISKGKNFDSAGFRSHTRAASAKFTSEYRAKETALRRDYNNGKISYNDYLKGNAKAFNTGLVALHNDISAGQKQYGYTYTLERKG